MQTGQQDPRENVLLELVVQLAAEPAFNQLRTTEQLGSQKYGFFHSLYRMFLCDCVYLLAVILGCDEIIISNL